jgi:HEXXH motif-containing protein
MSSCRGAVLDALNGGGPRWFPGLARYLASAQWSVLADRGIDPSTYGTERILDGRAPSPSTLGWLRSIGRLIAVEPFGSAMADRYEPLGVAPLDDEALIASAIFRLDAALGIVATVPGISAAIESLVHSVHLIPTRGPEYDASYSDPEVPFSVFIGIHAGDGTVDRLRLAESIVHEAMHLQLTLIEGFVPLVSGDVFPAYSPWQDRQRPAQGLLHGLYVFRGIQDFLAAIDPRLLDDGGLIHIERRVALIQEECVQLAALPASSDLTDEGRRLASRLLA